jgi:hypothetical protein
VTWRTRSLGDLLAGNGLTGVDEEPYPTDGWSGATFTLLRRSPSERFVLKRDSLSRDWIAQATLDTELREAALVGLLGARATTSTIPAGDPFMFGGPLRFPYLGAAADGEDAVILMPDLSGELLAWERPSHERPIGAPVVDRVLDAIARLHTTGWWVPRGDEAPIPWCPLPERLGLLARPAAEHYAAAGNPVGERFLEGWDAFDAAAPKSARDLIDRLAADPTPLLETLGRLPAVGLHGDLKLANVAVFEDGGIGFIDWQMATYAPVAVELGWLLVSNSAVLPFEPLEVLRRYAESLGWHVDRWGVGDFQPRTAMDLLGDADAQVDLAIVVGLLLRGWRKGLDARAGIALASGVSAVDDLAWWCARAVEAADRRLA